MQLAFVSKHIQALSIEHSSMEMLVLFPMLFYEHLPLRELSNHVCNESCCLFRKRGETRRQT